ncbi:MAG: S8 family serine peptidase [Bacteroidales bacterium]|nr:S8 family serine peptidase [Bacteroidales bacterium]
MNIFFFKRYDIEKLIVIISFLLISVDGFSNIFKYRIYLKDKGSYKVEDFKVDDLLSSRAQQRRIKENAAVDEYDLPIFKTYLKELESMGLKIVVKSKWLNSVVVSSDDSDILPSLKALPFVEDAKLVWKENGETQSLFLEASELDEIKAVLSRKQIEVHNGFKLHNAGYKGDGIEIAVIDAGFLNVDRIDAINKNVVGSYDFVDPQGDIYSTHHHGCQVLSVMASSDTSVLCGSAPNASYWLLRSEDSSSEFPVEEDYWVAAAEFADSVGVDIINSSLGYYLFDDGVDNYSQKDLNGETAFITKGANIAASKGILVVVSAGNEGQDKWKKISFPSDSKKVLTVGAVNDKNEPAYFTGVGFTAPYVKPDVAGVGLPAYVINTEGRLATNTGTSFSAPIVCGLAACLWQALPEKKSYEIMSILKQNSSMFLTPDSLVGYGVPNVYSAYTFATGIDVFEEYASIDVLPIDESGNIWRVVGLSKDNQNTLVEVITMEGGIVYNSKVNSENYSLNLSNLLPGLYVVRVAGKNINHSKIINKTL